MRRFLPILARTAGSVVGMLVGGVAVGFPVWQIVIRLPYEPDVWVLVAILLAALGFIVGGVTGAAAGATVTQKLLKRKSSFWRALLGTFVGLVIGGLLAFPLDGVFYNIVGPLLERNGYTVAYFIICTFVVAGAVIGSGWKVKPAPEAQGCTRDQD